MKELYNVTIISVTGVRGKQTLRAIEYSTEKIKFKYKKLLTPENLKSSDVEIIKINPISLEEYSKFIVYDLYKYIDTDYALIIQEDGFIINPDCWTDDFLNYDYIGAPWILPLDDFSYRDAFGNIVRVGNGGFSLRSKKLLSIADELNIPSFSKQKKLKEPKEVAAPAPVAAPSYVALTDEQIESCRKGQDIFDFARDIEELVRINNKL
jgi:hypothetical protein